MFVSFKEDKIIKLNLGQNSTIAKFVVIYVVVSRKCRFLKTYADFAFVALHNQIIFLLYNYNQFEKMFISVEKKKTN